MPEATTKKDAAAAKVIHTVTHPDIIAMASKEELSPGEEALLDAMHALTDYATILAEELEDAKK